MFGEKILGANLLNMESTIKGIMNVNTPINPGLSSSLDISTSALDSSARSLENNRVASFMVFVFSIDLLRICVEFFMIHKNVEAQHTS